MRAAAAAVSPKSRASVTKSRRESRNSFATGEAAWPLSVAVIHPSTATWSASCSMSAWRRQRIAKASSCSARRRPSAWRIGAFRSQKASADGTFVTESGGARSAAGVDGVLRCRVLRPALERALLGSGAGPREPMLPPVSQNPTEIRAEGAWGFPSVVRFPADPTPLGGLPSWRPLAWPWGAFMP